MNQYSKTKAQYFLPLRTTAVLVFMLSVVAVLSSGFMNGRKRMPATNNKDSVESVRAFLQVYRVLKSPRCMNCHPSGDIPLQGDDSHLHIMSPKRGLDGKGVYAMKCSNCHKPTNVAGLHTPPGNPKWHLPPADMKMVFQGKTPHQLALQIMDYKRNGHKNREQLLEHARDTLVKAGWHMGGNRTLPPLRYDEFVTVWDTWIKKGGYAPK